MWDVVFYFWTELSFASWVAFQWTLWALLSGSGRSQFQAQKKSWKEEILQIRGLEISSYQRLMFIIWSSWVHFFFWQLEKINCGDSVNKNDQTKQNKTRSSFQIKRIWLRWYSARTRIFYTAVLFTTTRKETHSDIFRQSKSTGKKNIPRKKIQINKSGSELKPRNKFKLNAKCDTCKKKFLLVLLMGSEPQWPFIIANKGDVSARTYVALCQDPPPWWRHASTQQRERLFWHKRAAQQCERRTAVTVYFVNVQFTLQRIKTFLLLKYLTSFYFIYLFTYLLVIFGIDKQNRSQKIPTITNPVL